MYFPTFSNANVARAGLFEQNASWPMSFNYDDDFACCSYAYALPEKMDTDSSVIRLGQRNRERKRETSVSKNPESVKQIILGV